MAAPNYYQTGTLTLTSGSVDFTTSGSALQSAGIRDGDIILVKGFSLPIASITSENAGTLLDPCPAAAAGAIPLRIAFQNDTQRYHAWAVWIRDKFSTGVFAGLGALTGAADKLAYMTGASTWGTIDFKEWARAFVGAADVAAAQTALGVTAVGKAIIVAADTAAAQTALGATAIGKAIFASADTAAAQTALGATAIGKAIFASADAAAAQAAIGASAVGNALIGAASADAAQTAVGMSTVGKSVATSANAGAAQAAIGGSTIGRSVFVAADAPAVRTAIGANDASNLTAGTLPDARVSTTLTPDKAYRRGSILGTVSQASGVPTGAIVERGSNANGEYVRFADGTQICSVSRSVTLTSNNPDASLFRDVSNIPTWTFPSAFVGTPVVQTSFVSTIWWGSASIITATSAGGFAAYCPYNLTTTTTCSTIAIGRWF